MDEIRVVAVIALAEIGAVPPERRYARTGEYVGTGPRRGDPRARSCGLRLTPDGGASLEFWEERRGRWAVEAHALPGDLARRARALIRGPGA